MHGSIADIVQRQSSPITARGEESILEAAKIMKKRNIGALMIVDGKGILRGIVSERDITRKVLCVGAVPDQTKVSDVMTKDPHCITSTDTPLKALEIMRENNFRHLPVIKNKRPIAMVSVRDLYDCVFAQMEEDLRQREAFIFGSGYGG